MQLFAATFVKNKSILLTTLLQQKLALVMSFQQFSDSYGFETEKVRGGRGLGWSARGCGLEVCGCGREGAKFLKLLRGRV